MLILLKKPDSDNAVSIDPRRVSAIEPHANGTQCIVHVEHRPFNVAGTVEEVTERINNAERWSIAFDKYRPVLKKDLVSSADYMKENTYPSEEKWKPVYNEDGSMPGIEMKGQTMQERRPALNKEE
jgi:hypothetical protein